VGSRNRVNQNWNLPKSQRGRRMKKKAIAKVKSSVTVKKITRKPRIKKIVREVSASRSTSVKLASRVSTRKKQAEFRPGPYYALGATALAFSFAFLIHQFSDRRSQAPTEMRISMGDQVSQGADVGSHSQLDSEFKKVHSLSLEERVNFWSSMIEKNPRFGRQLRQLVKNEKVNDLAPIVPEKFDCMTFVETVAALSRSDSPKELIGRLMEIRYREGQPSFQSRNHFVESDWIPNNQKAHVVADVTADLAAAGQVQVQLAAKSFRRDQWVNEQMRKQGIGRAISSVSNQVTEARIPYLSLEDLKKMMGQIPSGLVINFVRENSPRHPVLVSHQGLLIRGLDGQLMLRHASIGGRLRTEPLAHYISGMMAHNKKRQRWGWLGANLIQISSSSSPMILRKAVM